MISRQQYPPRPSPSPGHAEAENPGDEVVVVDAILDFSSRRMPDGLARRASRGDVDGVGGIKTVDAVGLQSSDVDLLRAWTAGGPVPRV
ncbi:MAG: hypothetical protein PIR02_06105 [Microbacterium enclense]